MKLLKKILFSLLLCCLIQSNAQESINDQPGRNVVILNGTGQPRHLIEKIPEAYYSFVSATLSIELDPVYYSQYTIIIQSDYASLDYIVTSPVVNIPVGSLDSVVDIYIESDDCGCYYGTLNQADYGKSP